MGEPTIADLNAAMLDHEERDKERFAAIALAAVNAGRDRMELLDLVKPMSTEIIGDRDSPGMRERLRTLEAKAINAKWIIGLVSGAVVVSIVDRIVGYIGTHGVPHP